MRITVQTIAATKDYFVGSSRIQAVRQVDFAAQKGELVCVSGRSGSGKSTLLNLLAGLEKPTSGQIILLNRHIEQMTETQRIRFRRDFVGFVFQSYNLLPQFSALENVALPLALRGTPTAERMRRAMEMLELVGLSDHAAHKPSELSGGQQQRVGIARAIITKPGIVFADEPTGNLDTKTGDEIMRLLIRIFHDWKTTLILVSHDPEMRRYTDREVRMLDGQLEAPTAD